MGSLLRVCPMRHRVRADNHYVLGCALGSDDQHWHCARGVEAQEPGLWRKTASVQCSGG